MFGSLEGAGGFSVYIKSTPGCKACVIFLAQVEADTRRKRRPVILLVAYRWLNSGWSRFWGFWAMIMPEQERRYLHSKWVNFLLLWEKQIKVQMSYFYLLSRWIHSPYLLIIPNRAQPSHFRTRPGRSMSPGVGLHQLSPTQSRENTPSACCHRESLLPFVLGRCCFG